MAQLEPSDQIVINNRDEEATWQREERPIARRSSLKLMRIRDEIRVHRIVLISIVDRESYNGRD